MHEAAWHNIPAAVSVMDTTPSGDEYIRKESGEWDGGAVATYHLVFFLSSPP